MEDKENISAKKQAEKMFNNLDKDLTVADFIKVKAKLKDRVNSNRIVKHFTTLSDSVTGEVILSGNIDIKRISDEDMLNLRNSFYSASLENKAKAEEQLKIQTIYMSCLILQDREFQESFEVKKGHETEIVRRVLDRGERDKLYNDIQLINGYSKINDLMYFTQEKSEEILKN